MNKLKDFLKKNYIIFIILFFLVIYYIYNKKLKEGMKCIGYCDKTKMNQNIEIPANFFEYFIKNFYHLLAKYNLGQSDLMAIRNIFDKMTYDVTNLEEYINSSKINIDKIDFKDIVNEIINSNRIWDSENNYNLDFTNKIYEIRQVYILDKIKSILKLQLENNEIDELLSFINEKILTIPKVTCTENDLISYCKSINNYNNSNSLEKDFKLISIKDNVENYPNNLFEKNANIGKIYSSITSQFTSKRKVDFDIYDREHFDYLVNDVLYPYGETNNILSDNDFKYIEETLRFQFKLLSVYLLINQNVDDKDRELAYKCCVDSIDDNRCFNFENIGEPYNPIVFGFDKFGYSNIRNCSFNKTNEENINNNILKEELDENKIWTKLNKNVKENFYETLRALLNLSISNKLDEDIKKMKVSSINMITKQRKIKDLFTSTIEIDKNYIEEENSNEVIDSINSSSTYYAINKILNENNLSENDFNLISVSTSTDKLKMIAIKLIEIKNLLLTYNAHNKNINFTISNILGVSNNNDTFHKILLDVGMIDRYHDMFMKNLIKILVTVNDIEIEKTVNILEQRPRNVIKYKNVFFPSNKNQDVCRNFQIILNNLRDSRKITIKEFSDYKKILSKYCKRRAIYLSNNKVLLYKDSDGKLLELYKFRTVNKFGKTIDILFANIDSKKQIINVRENIAEYTNLYIIDNKVTDGTNNTNEVKVTSIDFFNNFSNEFIIINSSGYSTTDDNQDDYSEDYEYDDSVIDSDLKDWINFIHSHI